MLLAECRFAVRGLILEGPRRLPDCGESRADFLSRMDQRLLVPPNVKGWDGEQKWINSSTWAVRIDFGRNLAQLDAEGGFGADLDIDHFGAPNIKDPVRVIDTVAEVLLQGDLSAEARRDLAEFLVMGEEGRSLESFRDDDDFRRQKVRSALSLILGLPEYHAY